MAGVYDPTNANAVAGPSRAPAAAPPSSAVPLPSVPRQPPSAAPHQQQQPAVQQQRQPVRRADGPVILSTLVGADGVKEVPSAFEHCEVDDLIALIASMLDRLIDHNDRIPLTSGSLTRFHSRAPPNISVRDYLVRIARYTNVEPCCLLILLPYVDKVCARMTSFTISSLTVHRFIIAAISVGSKALSDAFCTNGRYARVGGVSVVEMNLLEKEFCEALDWRLTTSGPVLAHYYTSLVRSHPLYRLSGAPLPVPPTPPPVDIPPFFSPSPVDSRVLPVSPSVAFGGQSLPMEVDSTGAGEIGEGGAGGAGERRRGSNVPVPMSTEPAPVDKPSPSSPPSPPAGQPTSYPPSTSVSPSSSSAYTRSASTSASVSLNPSPHASPEERPRGRERPNDLSSQQHTQQPSPPGPPLVPPRLSATAAATASHLPSPARSAPAPPPPPPGAAPASALSPRLARALQQPPSSSSLLTPSSPAKRARQPSQPSSPDKTGVSSSSVSAEGAARFQPSPRLSGGAQLGMDGVESGGGGTRTAAESAALRAAGGRL
ncbi:hypothetical protein JCM8547_002936 [Rhodosporidiobolus lusitaniae]